MRRLTLLVTALGLCSGAVSAQQVDARAALLASLEAMGGGNRSTDCVNPALGKGDWHKQIESAL